MPETGVRSPIEAHWIFLSEPTVTFGAQCGAHWSICMVKAWGHFPQRGVNVMTDSCLGGLVVMTLARNARDRGSIPRWGTLNFSVRTHCYIWCPMWGPLIYLYGQSVRTHFPQRGVNVMTDSCLSGYDTCPECERPGFDPPLRHTEFFCQNPLLHLV